MKSLILIILILFPLMAHSQTTETAYLCKLKIHCSQLHEDQSISFEYTAGIDKTEAKTVELGTVRARVYGPHYFSLYLFDTRNPNTIWTKTHSHALIDDLEVSLIIPEDENHTMVANLGCWKKQ